MYLIFDNLTAISLRIPLLDDSHNMLLLKLWRGTKGNSYPHSTVVIWRKFLVLVFILKSEFILNKALNLLTLQIALHRNQNHSYYSVSNKTPLFLNRNKTMLTTHIMNKYLFIARDCCSNTPSKAYNKYVWSWLRRSSRDPWNNRRKTICNLDTSTYMP